MHHLNCYQKRKIKYNLVNKFVYKNTKKLPQLKQIVLNFGCKEDTKLGSIAPSLLAIELVTKQKGAFTITKHSNILRKTRKGNPVGCKVSLRKQKMLIFLEKLLFETFTKIKSFDGIALSKKVKGNAFSFQIYDTFSFSELEEHYYLFNNLPKLDITFVTNAQVREEMVFLLRSLQLPIKI
jgi:large subunit ribosomal protein L5